MTVRAAVDCGTNMTRLLVAAEGRELERRQEFTRLGEGVDASRRIHPEAIRRTMEVLSDYRATMERHGATECSAVVTSVARDAVNQHEVLLAASGALGHTVRVIDGDEEARLAFAGATSALDPADGPFLIADIGGGSTELAAGEPGTAPATVSIDVGSVRLTERWLRADPPDPLELSQAVTVVRAHLEDVRRSMPEVAAARTLVGVAGTWTTMAAVEIGLIEYARDRVHHFDLTHEAAEDVFRTLATEKLEDRVHNPGLRRERADVIVGGAIIAVGIMREFNFGRCVISELDLLDGLLASAT